MPRTRLVAPAGISPHDLTDDHLELAWWNTGGSTAGRAGRLIAELLAVALGLRGEGGCQPKGVDLRWHGGTVLASFLYGDDTARARCHIAVLQCRLAP